MKQFAGNAGRKQRGDMLLEALISMLLLGVLGLGLSYAGARVLVQQRYATTQDLALSQMRFALESQGLYGPPDAQPDVRGLCDGAVRALQIGATQLIPSLQCTTQPVTVTVTPASGLPAMTAPITAVMTQMRYATPDGNAQAIQLLGTGSVVIHQ